MTRNTKVFFGVARERCLVCRTPGTSHVLLVHESEEVASPIPRGGLRAGEPVPELPSWLCALTGGISFWLLTLIVFELDEDRREKAMKALDRLLNFLANHNAVTKTGEAASGSV